MTADKMPDEIWAQRRPSAVKPSLQGNINCEFSYGSWSEEDPPPKGICTRYIRAEPGTAVDVEEIIKSVSDARELFIGDVRSIIYELKSRNLLRTESKT